MNTAEELTPEQPGTGTHVGASALVVVSGAVVGAFSVGVISRLAMFGLVRLNPEAGGRRTDDGFEMGQFTVSGSLNLMVVGVFLGFVSGLFYLALERLRFGPDWFRTLSIGVGAGVVAATQVIHSDGVDFRILEPLALAVALFIAVPVLHVAMLDVVAVRIRARLGVPVPSLTGPIAWILRAGLVVLFVIAVVSLVTDVRDLSG